MTSVKASGGLIRRKPILSARMVAIAVIFGAINGAFSALQISIPGYLPGVTFDFGGLWLTLATMIGGPIAGAVVTFVGSLVDPQVGIIGWPGYLIHVLIFAAIYPRVYRIKNIPLRIVAFILTVMVALFVQYWYWIVLFAFVYKAMPFVAMLALDFGYAYWVFLLIYCLVPLILLIAVPRLVAPEWRWPWQKDSESDEEELEEDERVVSKATPPEEAPVADKNTVSETPAQEHVPQENTETSSEAATNEEGA